MKPPIPPGAVYGRWTVLSSPNRSVCQCRCSCAAKTVALVTTTNLRRGTSRGCKLHKGPALGSRWCVAGSAVPDYLALASRGVANADIARMFGVTRQAVHAAVKRRGAS